MIKTEEERNAAIENSINTLIEEYESLLSDLEHQVTAQKSVEHIERYNWNWDKEEWCNRVNSRLKTKLIRVTTSLEKAYQTQHMSEPQKQWFRSNFDWNH